MGWVPSLGEGRRIYMSSVLYERGDEREERVWGERKRVSKIKKGKK
jgi:hypothetical protein